MAGHDARAAGAQEIPARSRPATAAASSTDCRLGGADRRARRHFHRAAGDAAATARSTLHPLATVRRVVPAARVDPFDGVAAGSGGSGGSRSASWRGRAGIRSSEASTRHRERPMPPLQHNDARPAHQALLHLQQVRATFRPPLQVAQQLHRRP